LIRTAAASLATLGAAVAFTLSGVGAAQAAAAPQQVAHQAGTGTGAASGHLVPGASSIKLTLHPTSSVTPNTSFTCIVSFPSVTVIFASGEISWTASTQCSIPLSMQGTTVLYQWGSSSAFAFGNAYNAFTSFSTSSGSIFGIFGGSWGVNHNVLLTFPAGFTSTPGAGCSFASSADNPVICHETTGPFTA
jgi:hypothetical protein